VPFLNGVEQPQNLVLAMNSPACQRKGPWATHNFRESLRIGVMQVWKRLLAKKLLK